MNRYRNAQHRIDGTSALKYDTGEERGRVIEYPHARVERSRYGRTVSVHMVPAARRTPVELSFSEAVRMGVGEAFERRESDMAGSWNGRTRAEARTLYVGTTLVAALTMAVLLAPYLI